MKKDGALGPGGFWAFFFQTRWESIEEYVLKVVLKFSLLIGICLM